LLLQPWLWFGVPFLLLLLLLLLLLCWTYTVVHLG
jgi:hypothetical protein